jgi:hypothetical protein
MLPDRRPVYLLECLLFSPACTAVDPAVLRAARSRLCNRQGAPGSASRRSTVPSA